MSLQLIFGRAHSGKTQYVLNKAAEIYSDNKPLIVVVPEQFTHLAEKKLIEKLGSIEYGRAEVLSFDRIAKRINSAYPDGKKHLNSVAKSLILSEIISETELDYYKNASDDVGFAEVCINEISEFKKYNMTADDVLTASGRVGDRGLSLKLSDISKIYKAYEDKISSSFADSDDALAILADNLEKHMPYKGFTFLFDEFSSFNPVEKRVISALAVQCDMIYMSFCADKSEKYKYLFKPTVDTANSVAEICKSVSCDVLEPVCLRQSYYANEEMAFLEENIFAYPSSVYSDVTKNIRIYNSENPYMEVTALASQIQALVREKNIRYRDIGVICADIGSYSHIFRSVFKSFDIPCFIDEKTDVLKHSVICFVTSVIDVYLMGYNSESVINYLKSGHLDAARDDLMNTDNFIRAANASKNVWLSDEKWAKTLETYCEGDEKLYSSIDRIRENYILPLASFHDDIKGKNTVRYISEKLYKFLLSCKFDENVYEYIKHFKSIGNNHMAKQYESVWKILIETLDILVQILGDKKVNLTQYRKYLFTAFSEQKIGVIPTSLDLIMVGDVKRSKSETVTYQFIVGVYDGVFPAPSKGKSIITDSDKVQIASAGFEFSPDSRDKALFERFLTYSALTHSMKSLVISYPSSDSSFSAVRPSFTLTLLKNIFPGIRESSTALETVDMQLSNFDSAMEFLASSAFMLTDGKTPDPHWQDVYSYCAESGKKYSIGLINSAINKSAQIIKLKPELIESLFKDEFYSTISRLQRYNSCRYSYYLEYMLGLKDKKTYGLESTDIGTYVHTIIEKTFEEMNKESLTIESMDKDSFLNITTPLFEEHLSELFVYSDELTDREEYRLKIIKDSVINALMHIKAHLSGSAFKPIGHEITFDDNNVGCICLELANGKTVKLTGKIDRADSFENENGTFIRVIDYKTGSKTFSLSDAFYGLDIQLIVYLNTLVKNTEHAHHAGALFFRIQNPIADFTNHPDADEITSSLAKLNAMTGLVAEDETVLNAFTQNSLKAAKKASFSQFSLLSDYVESIIKNSAENLSCGNIEINPYVKSGSSPCNYCPYGTVCGFKEGKTGECRKLGRISDKEVWETLVKSSKEGENK